MLRAGGRYVLTRTALVPVNPARRLDTRDAAGPGQGWIHINRALGTSCAVWLFSGDRLMEFADIRCCVRVDCTAARLATASPWRTPSAGPLSSTRLVDHSG